MNLFVLCILISDKPSWFIVSINYPQITSLGVLDESLIESMLVQIFAEHNF